MVLRAHSSVGHGTCVADWFESVQIKAGFPGIASTEDRLSVELATAERGPGVAFFPVVTRVFRKLISQYRILPTYFLLTVPGSAPRIETVHPTISSGGCPHGSSSVPVSECAHARS